MPFGEDLGAGVGGHTTGMGFSNSGDNNRKKFTGYERDNETGLDFAQARFYASAHGRFTSPDPFSGSAIITNPQTFNRYAFVGNNPINSVDPTGLAEMGARFSMSYGDGREMRMSSKSHGAWSENREEIEALWAKQVEFAFREIENGHPHDAAVAVDPVEPAHETAHSAAASAAAASQPSGPAPQTPTPQTPSYPIAENAAIAALVIYNPISIQQNLEYAGEICRQLSDNRFIYTLGPANARMKDSSDPGTCPAGTVEDADWHTHAAVDPQLVHRGFLGIGRRDDNEIFSKADRISNNRDGIRGYLATPSGAIKVFTPGAHGQQHSTKGQVRTLSQRTPIR